MLNRFRKSLKVNQAQVEEVVDSAKPIALRLEDLAQIAGGLKAPPL